MTQAEIGVELSKERKSQKFPASEFPHALVKLMRRSTLRSEHDMHLLEIYSYSAANQRSAQGGWTLEFLQNIDVVYGAKYPMKLLPY
jgi:hypothetical protein